MTPEFILNYAIAPALYFLPSQMNSPAARAMLLAIGLQESGLNHRVQVNGPARGYWQFERAGGVHGVLNHPASKPYIRHVLAALNYTVPVDVACYEAIEHNDVLAAAFARLLLWTLPGPLPNAGEYDEAWDQYVAAWRPGAAKDHRLAEARGRWDLAYTQAWYVVTTP